MANQLTATLDGYTPNTSNHDLAAERIATSLRVLYGATPFWLDATTAWTVMAIKPLTAEDRSELRLANPALVLFGAGKEITDPYLTIDPDFAYRLNDDLDRTEDQQQQGPVAVRAGTLETLRYLNRRDQNHEKALFGYQLLGVIITPNDLGGLADPVWWILRRIDTPTGATTQTVALGEHGTTTTTSSSFFLIEGRLSEATLSPIAEALAAVISWGTWTQPQPWKDPGTPLRKQARTSAFRKAEQAGAFTGIRVLNANTPSQGDHNDANNTDGVGRSVATHWRSGHWQRYRVGPRDDWTYQRRRIPGQLINPGNDPIRDIITIYRLPPPPN